MISSKGIAVAVLFFSVAINAAAAPDKQHKCEEGSAIQNDGRVYLKCVLRGQDSQGNFSIVLDERRGVVIVDGEATINANFGQTTVTFVHDEDGPFYKEMAISRIDLKANDYLRKIDYPKIPVPFASGTCAKSASPKRIF